MLDHAAAILALRNRLLSLQFAGTGDTTLANTGTRFTRAAGSFIDDGFVPGMEVVPVGFADNTPAIIKNVTDLEITTYSERTPEASAPNRSLTVGIPSIRAWENVKVNTQDLRWFIEEDYIPGPTSQITASNINADLNHFPQYVLRIAGLSGKGVSALYLVVQGILNGFNPGLALVLPDGRFIRVQTNPAPYAGQVLPGDAGRSEVVVTIPLWAETRNLP